MYLTNRRRGQRFHFKIVEQQLPIRAIGITHRLLQLLRRHVLSIITQTRQNISEFPW